MQAEQRAATTLAERALERLVDELDRCTEELAGARARAELLLRAPVRAHVDRDRRRASRARWSSSGSARCSPPSPVRGTPGAASRRRRCRASR